MMDEMCWISLPQKGTPSCDLKSKITRQCIILLRLCIVQALPCREKAAIVTTTSILYVCVVCRGAEVLTVWYVYYNMELSTAIYIEKYIYTKWDCLLKLGCSLCFCYIPRLINIDELVMIVNSCFRFKIE